MDPVFRNKINSSVEEVKRILGTERNPVLAENVPHTYDDKYNLAAWTTSLAAMGSLNVLEKLGFTQPQLVLAKKYKQEGKSVTIRRLGTFECESLGKEEKMVESGTYEVTQSTSLFGNSKTTKSVETKVTVYLWKYTCSWEVCMFPGTSFPEEKTTLTGRTGSVVLRVTGSDKPPYQEANVLPYSDMSLDWFLSLLSDSGSLEFKINRGVETCRTPCQNEDIKKAKNFFSGLLRWCDGARNFVRTIFSAENQARNDDNMPRRSIDGLIQRQEGMFVPILPIMEMKQDSVMLNTNDSHQFLERQTSGIAKALETLQEQGKLPIPENAMLLSTTEATLAFMAVHGKNLCVALESSLRYIENMLYVQLESAVGKKIDFLEFQQYMRYHTSKLFNREFSPKPFCYSVRRPGRYPEGTLMIETINLSNEAKNEPVTTIVREAPGVYPMQFSLDAATKVTFGGRRFLHSMVRHTFKSKTQGIQLVARARQFSSFILLIGTLSSKSEFDPTDAIIVKNKDKLKVELLLETIPTAKEFKDAISSLSPEQQRFAKSFRSMQLAGTLFSVCIIQIKPQLETLLNLPCGSLTKEIKLTENLMDLFVEYQIPSDLLSYDGDLPIDNRDGASTSNVALEQVRSHVKKMNDMLDGMKKKVVEADAYVALHRNLEESSGSEGEEEEGSKRWPPVAKGLGASPFNELSASSATFMSAAPRRLKMGFGRRGGGELPLPHPHPRELVVDLYSIQSSKKNRGVDHPDGNR